MSHRYREELRRRAAHDDAAFIEYMADLVVPDHLREMSAVANRHRMAVVLEPRGFGKTTLVCHRAARLVGLSGGAIRIGILCAVDEDAENLAAAVRRIVEHPRFAEVFPWAAIGVEGPRWRDGAWTVRGVELGKDVTCRALSIGSVHAGPRLDLLLADDPVGLQENATPAGRAKVLDTLLGVVLPMLVPDGRVRHRDPLARGRPLRAAGRPRLAGAGPPGDRGRLLAVAGVVQPRGARRATRCPRLGIVRGAVYERRERAGRRGVPPRVVQQGRRRACRHQPADRGRPRGVAIGARGLHRRR